jgi:hypothetical protein
MGGRVVTVGDLIVNLRTDAATFTASMEEARGETEKLGKGAKSAQKSLEQFAARGLGDLIPGAEAAGASIARLVANMLKMSGPLKMFGTLGLIAGGAYAFGKAVQYIDENFRNLITHGETVAAQLARINKEVEEGKKFLEERARAQQTQLSLDKQLMQLRGDDLGLAQAARREREETILKTTQGAERTAALAKSAAIAEEEAAKIRREASEKWMAQIDAEQKAQLASWQTETNALIKQLQDRASARAAFEAQLGTGGVGGVSALSGLREASELSKKIQSDFRDIAFASREGKLTDAEKWRELQRVQQGAASEAERLRGQYADFPSVLESVNAAVRDIEFGQFTNAMILAESWVRQNIATDQELVATYGQLAAKLSETQPATEGASQAFAEAARQAAGLQQQVWGLVNAFSAYNSTVAGGGP